MEFSWTRDRTMSPGLYYKVCLLSKFYPDIFIQNYKGGVGDFFSFIFSIELSIGWHFRYLLVDISSFQMISSMKAGILSLAHWVSPASSTASVNPTEWRENLFAPGGMTGKMHVRLSPPMGWSCSEQLSRGNKTTLSSVMFIPPVEWRYVIVITVAEALNKIKKVKM